MYDVRMLFYFLIFKLTNTCFDVCYGGGMAVVVGGGRVRCCCLVGGLNKNQPMNTHEQEHVCGLYFLVCLIFLKFMFVSLCARCMCYPFRP